MVIQATNFINTPDMSHIMFIQTTSFINTPIKYFLISRIKYFLILSHIMVIQTTSFIKTHN